MAAADEHGPGRPFRSLTNTLIRSIAIAGAICAVVVSLLQLVLTYHAQRRNFESEVESIARTNVPLLSINLWDIEPDAIQRQMNLITDRPQIAHARLEAVSIGVSSVDPGELPAYVARGTAMSGTAELLGRADQALYEAKAAGRNRVVGIAFASSEAMQKPVLPEHALNPVKP